MKKNKMKNAFFEMDSDAIDRVLSDRCEKMCAEDALSGKKSINGGKAAATGSFVRKRLIAAAAAVLAIAAILIPLGIALSKKPEAPDPQTPVPSTAATKETVGSPKEASGFCFYDEKDFGTAELDQNFASEPELEPVGLRALKIDGGIRLAYRSNASLFDIENGGFAGSRQDSREYLHRWYRNGTENNEKIYFSGGVVGCLATGDPLEKPGVFEYDMKTGKITPYLISDSPILGMCFYDGALYFCARGEAVTVRRTDKVNGGSFNDTYAPICIFKADPTAGTVEKLCETDLRNTLSSFFEVDESGVWLTGEEKDDYARLLLHYSLKENEIRAYGLPDGGACALIDGRIYHFTSAFSDKTALRVLENGEWRLLFEDDAPFPHTTRIVGSTCDLPTFHNGKLVAVRDNAILLIDTETKEETVLKTGVVNYAGDRVSLSMNTDNHFTKISINGRLFFADLTHTYGEPDLLYTFSGEELVKEIRLDRINETVS
ncbi:MAG: hypothetical protein IJU52_05815 [Clostridia bacterium]|nr:hypothetical protein [Clostridia bacterium]